MTGTTSKIGEILVQRGLVRPEQLEEALRLASAEKVRVGEALVRMGAVDDGQLAWALGVQYDLSYVDLSEEMIDWRLLLTMPLRKLRRLCVLPMMQADTTIHAVIADPTMSGLSERLMELFPEQSVLLQLAPAEEILRLIAKAEAMKREEDQLSGRERAREERRIARLDLWLTELGAGLMDRMAIYPDVEGSGVCRVFCDPETSDHGSIREADLVAAIPWLVEQFRPPGQPAHGFPWTRPGSHSEERRPLRLAIESALAGWLVALQAVTASNRPLGFRRRILLVGLLDADDLALLCGPGAAPAICLCSYTEKLRRGLVSVERRGWADRLRAAATLGEFFDKSPIAVEVDSGVEAEEFLGAEIPGAGVAVGFLGRQLASVATDQWVGRGDVVVLPPDSDGRRARLQGLLEEVAGE